MNSWRFYRRKLPHWRGDQVIYFVTWRLGPNQEGLTPPERELVAAAMRHFNGRRYALEAYVVMDDHVHALLDPRAPYELQDIIHSWKSFSANRLQREHARRGGVWLDEYFDRVVRDEEELGQKLEYVLGNPWKRWPGLEAYRWVWAREE